MDDSSFIYSLSLFDEIKNNGFTYQLPEKTLRIINKISKQVGSPTYIKTPIFRKKHREHVIKTEDWKQLRNFESTKLEKYKEEIDKHINDIRNNLNKITDVTYDVIKEELLDKIDDMLEKMSNEHYMKLLDCFIQTGVSNKFYSTLYSRLLREVLEKYPTMKGYISCVLKQIQDEFKTILSKDDKMDYDTFCDMNLQMDKEVNYYVFITTMYKEGLYSQETLSENLNYILTYIEDCVYNGGGEKEILNHSITILSNVIPLLEKNEITEELKMKERMNGLLRSGRDTKKMITRKTLIKIMDLIDKI